MTQKLSVKRQANGTGREQRPDPEVVPQAKRRAFSAAYKLRILKEADRCHQRGQIGALLRREGLYSSHLTTWRRQRAAGQLAGLGPKRGRKKDEQAAGITTLCRENERLRAQLKQADLIISAQKTCASLRADVEPGRGRDIMRTATEALAEQIPLRRACAAFDYPRSSLYRQRQPVVKKNFVPGRRHPGR